MQRFDPFRELRHFSRLLDSPRWDAPRWGDPRAPDVDRTAEAWRIPMDVHRDDRQLTVTASLPGCDAADVDVSISPDRVLSVKAVRSAAAAPETAEYLRRERRAGSFARAIRLPGDLDFDAAAVNLARGVLTVTLPVAAAAQTRRLPISAAAPPADPA